MCLIPSNVYLIMVDLVNFMEQKLQRGYYKTLHLPASILMIRGLTLKDYFQRARPLTRAQDLPLAALNTSKVSPGKAQISLESDRASSLIP